MSEESVPTVAEVVESWNVPADAPVAARIRSNILVAIERGYDDPQLVADLAVGPLVMALGQLEVELADARRRIEDLERTVSPGNGGAH
ncbi:hypothetical protein IU500_12665 [Nocardia terpenica]|uniref:Uncharacterized protein n=1 Tax=Nocardia terpenica TaxID=455432 RepID=A0A164IKS3_9NOCA|nr:hypothetical protein [Nocardia terpenica]KZM69535.1 hypothetical protein AWN90_08495 [Nocardia terpenica]MBF6062970.1 hypothetical protein [Nocardia terpenica]MBF6104895.1 hypothetical protein [Nocardia terpenica]MBF6112668.1 hypothetical protein [Nocardia terpenica]MBF6118623.1 hypothetical protein [Nocardia terpenica]